MESVKINYEKLRETRKKLNLSIAEVAEKIDIPAPTLQKYESKVIKKVPLKILKKLCSFYQKDYTLYFWWTKFTSISEVIFYFLNIPELFKDEKNEIIKFFKLEKYFKTEKISNSSYFKYLYNNLTEEEKKDYLRFETIVKNFLKSDKYFKNDELEKENEILFCYFLAHKIKKEKNSNIEV